MCDCSHSPLRGCEVLPHKVSRRHLYNSYTTQKSRRMRETERGMESVVVRMRVLESESRRVRLGEREGDEEKGRDMKN